MMFSEPIGTQLFKDMPGMETVNRPAPRPKPPIRKRQPPKTITIFSPPAKSKEAGADFVPRRVITDQIISHVAEHYNLPVPAIRVGRRKTRTVTLARHMIMYLLHHIHGVSSIQIGRTMARDHSTVLYGMRRIERDHLETAERLIESFGYIPPDSDKNFYL